MTQIGIFLARINSTRGPSGLQCKPMIETELSLLKWHPSVSCGVFTMNICSLTIRKGIRLDHIRFLGT